VRILVINLTRLGDIIQSIGLIKGLKNRYPECEIDFLAMSSFSAILKNIPDIHEIVCLEDHLLIDQIKDDLWSGFLELTSKIQYLNNKFYDLVINPVISLQSSYLCNLIQAKDKRGMIQTPEGEQSVKSNWSAYLLANQHTLGDHAFNLVNIFAGVGDCEFKIDDYFLQSGTSANAFIKTLFENEQIDSSKKLIGFHVGASQSNKSWSVDSFKKVIIELCLNSSYEVILFGGYKESDVKSQFDNIRSTNFHNWIGKFKLDELISAVSKMNLFITNDTGPMHIAACTKVPIINLSLGPVSMWETGPYSDQAIVLQANIDCHPCSFSYNCPHWNCHSQITPEAVIQLSNMILTQTAIHEDPQILYWKSVIDPFLFIHWVPLNKRQITDKEYLFEVKRCIWGLTLKNLFSKADVVFKDYFSFLNSYFVFSTYSYPDLSSLCDKLLALNEQLINQLLFITTISQNSKNNLDKIKTIWSNVKELKNTMYLEAQHYSVIYDWFLYLTFAESQLENEDLSELTRQTVILYKQLSAQLRLLQIHIQ